MKYGWLIYSIFHPLTQAARLSAFQRRVDALAVSVVFSAGLEQVWNQHSTSFPKKLNRGTLDGLVTQPPQRNQRIPRVSTASPQCSAALNIFLITFSLDWWVKFWKKDSCSKIWGEELNNYFCQFNYITSRLDNPKFLKTLSIMSWARGDTLSMSLIISFASSTLSGICPISPLHKSMNRRN